MIIQHAAIHSNYLTPHRSKLLTRFFSAVRAIDVCNSTWRCHLSKTVITVRKSSKMRYLYTWKTLIAILNYFAACDERNSSRSTQHVCVWRVTLVIILSCELAYPTHTPLHYWRIVATALSPHSALQGARNEMVKLILILLNFLNVLHVCVNVCFRVL